MIELIIGGVACAAVLLCLAFSLKLKLRTYAVCTNKVDRELRVVQISDLHDCVFGENQCGLVKMTADCKPDIIVMTGDIVEDDIAAASAEILTPLHPARILIEQLLEIAPVYMVFGNHEARIAANGQLRSELTALGVRMLSDEAVRLDIDSCRLVLCGVDDPYFTRAVLYDRSGSFAERLKNRIRDDSDSDRSIEVWRERFRRTFGGIGRERGFTLLLSHRPEEFALYRECGFDAAMSGHAHGGQLRLPPFINGVYAPHQGLFPRHAGGCYRCDGFAHVVSRGLSKKRFPRLFNRPEVCLLRILPENPDAESDR